MKRQLHAALANHLPWVILGTLWLVAVCAGFAMLTEYANRPAITEPTASHWPIGTQLQLSDDDGHLGAIRASSMSLHRGKS